MPTILVPQRQPTSRLLVLLIVLMYANLVTTVTILVLDGADQELPGKPFHHSSYSSLIGAAATIIHHLICLIKTHRYAYQENQPGTGRVLPSTADETLLAENLRPTRHPMAKYGPYALIPLITWIPASIIFAVPILGMAVSARERASASGNSYSSTFSLEHWMVLWPYQFGFSWALLLSLLVTGVLARRFGRSAQTSGDDLVELHMRLEERYKKGEA